MTPSDFVGQMQRNLSLKGVLTPRQVVQAQPFLDVGYEFIAKRLEENYDDMTPEAVDIALKLQSFLLVFIEHGNNFALLRKVEAYG